MFDGFVTVTLTRPATPPKLTSEADAAETKVGAPGIVVVVVVVTCATQLAVPPPFDPAQLQLQGPDPDTEVAVPVVQRLVVGVELKD